MKKLTWKKIISLSSSYAFPEGGCGTFATPVTYGCFRYLFQRELLKAVHLNNETDFLWF